MPAATVIFGVALTPGSGSGAASGTRLEYEQNGRREVVTTTTGLRLLDQQKC